MNDGQIDYSHILTSPNIQAAYDEQYTDTITEWRTLGGKFKAQHVVDLCNRQNLSIKNVLEVGAGEGAILHHLDEWGFCDDVYALEISKSGVEAIQKRQIPLVKQVQIFDGYHIPYQDDEFDLVILSHVLEHVEFPRLLLREIWRVSKYLVIEVPCDYSPHVDDHIEHFMSYGHLNIYTPPLLRYLLKTEGYIILDDLVSTTDPEVIEYMYFELQKRPKTRLSFARVHWQHKLRDWLFALRGRVKQEQKANAYTALCKKGMRPDIF